MNWKPLKDFNELPKQESFLVWDRRARLGCSVVEACLTEEGGKVIDLSSCEELFGEENFNDCTHWCEIEWPTTKQENYTSEEQNQNHINKEWEEKFRWETARQFMLANPKMTTALAVLGVDQLIAELKKGRG